MCRNAPGQAPTTAFFPGTRGDLTLERLLTPQETAEWSSRVRPARKPGEQDDP